MSGILLTQWTIRLALACYVAAVALWLASFRPHRVGRWSAIARWLWTLGCGLFLLHVACAFHFHHGWSHAAAWETTAEETDRMLGVRFGDGIYFSYLFTALWALDVAWMWVARMWLRPRRDELGERNAGELALPRRSLMQTFRFAIHLFLLFIAFNGAIVFEAGPTHWAGLAACMLLAGLAGRAAYNGAGKCRVRIADCEVTRSSERGTRSAERAEPSSQVTHTPFQNPKSEI